jgi:hypothetical protein
MTANERERIAYSVKQVGKYSEVSSFVIVHLSFVIVGDSLIRNDK